MKMHTLGKIHYMPLIALLALTAGAVSWYQLSITEPPTEAAKIATRQATLLPQLKKLTPFFLSDQKGEAFDNQRLLGQWTFFSFGYTHCPDICPSTLALLAQMDDQLKLMQTAIPYRIAFVSIDPERDSPQRLAAYLNYFEPSFLGVTGNEEALRDLTQPLGILYRKMEMPESAMGYVMDHSASIILIDPEGRYYALFSPPHDAAIMVDDFVAIAHGYNR